MLCSYRIFNWQFSYTRALREKNYNFIHSAASCVQKDKPTWQTAIVTVVVNRVHVNTVLNNNNIIIPSAYIIYNIIYVEWKKKSKKRTRVPEIYTRTSAACRSDSIFFPAERNRVGRRTKEERSRPKSHCNKELSSPFNFKTWRLQ